MTAKTISIDVVLWGGGLIAMRRRC